MSTTLRFCNSCHDYLYPGNIPKSHKDHAADFNAQITHCFVCRTNIVDGVFNGPHEAHIEQEAQARRKAAEKMTKQQVTNNVIDHGNFIPLGVGSRLEPESIVKRIARDKIK